MADADHSMADLRLRQRVVDAGLAGGLVAIGVTDAAPLHEARVVLEERRAEGLHGGMQFTYRNPARSTEPGRILAGAAAIVVGALPYSPVRPPSNQADHPAAAVARYATADHYAELRQALAGVAAVLEGAGHATRVVADDNALVDRAVAHRAGLGWWGKNTNLLVPGHGSWVVLGSVVTDAPLAPSEAVVPDGCGGCRRCLDGCPTGAIVAPGVLDARRCLAWLVQDDGVFPRRWRTALGNRIYGCDDCQEVCPPSRPKASSASVGAVAEAPVGVGGGSGTSGRSHPPLGDEQTPHRGAWVPLIDLLAASDDVLMARHGRWYIPRREARYLRRNALVALGNVGDPADERVVHVLAEHVAHPDPLVQAHAVWACRRLGLDHLVAGVRDPSHPLVADELAADVARAR
ncbi:MAG: tRNA epoxyqueuosine(34) reductase QueG [Acidimicrobiia bacterium]|nr:tRNA epoxyqueuosine(34) reductase QueG [Acidimicrobiia bacterium]